MNTFELPAFLEGVTAKRKGTNAQYPPLKPGWYYVNEASFFYMVLGQYSPQPEQQLISREWVNNARSRWDAYVAVHGETPPAGVRPTIGLDVADMGKDKNVLSPKYGGFLARFKTWHGVDPTETTIKASAEYHVLNASDAYVDALGVGAGVAPGMQKDGCVAIGVRVSQSPTRRCDLGEFKQIRDQLYWSLREWLRTDPGAMIPPDDEFIQELLTPTYDIRDGKIKVMPKNHTEGKVCMKDLLKRSPDKMESVILHFASDMGGYFDDCQIDDYPEEMRDAA